MSPSGDRPDVAAARAEADAALRAFTQAFTEARAAAGPDDAPWYAARGELGSAVRAADAAWWRLAEAVARERAAGSAGNEPAFTDDDRLLLDAGWIGPEPLGDDADAIRARILQDLLTPGRRRLFHLSEWLGERLRTGALLEQERRDADDDASEEVRHLRGTRTKIWNALSPHMKGLPGAGPQVIEAIVSGRLDEQIEALRLRLLGRDDDGDAGPDRESLERLEEVRDRVCSRIKDTARDERVLQLVDAVRAMHDKIWQAMLADEMRDAPAADTDGGAILSPAERADRVADELNLVRSLLPLGLTPVGLRRSVSFLAEDRPRCTRTRINALMDRVVEFCPTLPGRPRVLLLPYVGTGFFEWDRDSLVLPVHPVEGAAEALADAVGNYLMMWDRLHQDGRLQKAYQIAHGHEKFRDGFTRDFRTWLLEVCAGDADALPPLSFKFFLENIGPRPGGVLVPHDLRNLSPEELESRRSDLAERCDDGRCTPEDLWRLAALLWQEKKREQAFRRLEQAVDRGPEDPRVLLSYGYLAHGRRELDRAQAAFEQVRDEQEGTLWAVCAGHALNPR